jgi:CD109 antigen
MAILEVNLPSGFAFDADGLEEIKSVENVKRFEMEEGDSQLNVYFDFLTSKRSCLNLPANRVFKVANPAKAYVMVYDYYDTTLRAREFYNPPEYSACEICVGEEACAIKNCV